MTNVELHFEIQYASFDILRFKSSFGQMAEISSIVLPCTLVSIPFASDPSALLPFKQEPLS